VGKTGRRGGIISEQRNGTYLGFQRRAHNWEQGKRCGEVVAGGGKYGRKKKDRSAEVPCSWEKKKFSAIEFQGETAMLNLEGSNKENSERIRKMLKSLRGREGYERRGSATHTKEKEEKDWEGADKSWIASRKFEKGKRSAAAASSMRRGSASIQRGEKSRGMS